MSQQGQLIMVAQISELSAVVIRWWSEEILWLEWLDLDCKSLH
jgi:hypothetical protein